MKKLLELILGKANKDWTWFINWVNLFMKKDLYQEMLKDDFCNMIYDYMEQRPKLLTQLVIDLASEIWVNEYKTEGNCGYIITLMRQKLIEFILDIPVKEKESWLLKELKGK